MAFNLFSHGPELLCTSFVRLELGDFKVSPEKVTRDGHNDPFKGLAGHTHAVIH